MQNNQKQTLLRQNIVMWILFFCFIPVIFQVFRFQVIAYEKFQVATEKLVKIKKRIHVSINIRDLNNDLLAYTIPAYDVYVHRELIEDIKKLQEKNKIYQMDLEEQINNLKSTVLDERKIYLIDKKMDTWKIKKIKNGMILKDELPLLNNDADILWETLIKKKYIQEDGEITNFFLSLKNYSNLDIEYDKKIKKQVFEILQKAKTKFKNFQIDNSNKRYYAYTDLACHLLGVRGVDNKGLSGIEQTIDDQIGLKNKTYTQTHLKDHRGRIFNMQPQDFTEDIQLAIDKTLQSMVEIEMLKFYQNQKKPPKSITVILQEPNSGLILVSASYPNFDANAATSHISDENILFNNLVQMDFEPGSTLKVIPFAIALEEELPIIDEIIDCEKGYWRAFYDFKVTDHDDGYDKLTFGEVFQHSSNIGTAKVAQKIGKNKFVKYLQKFGLGSRLTNITGESPGRLTNIDKWSMATLLSVSFGQEISVTPIQLISVYSTIANGGYLVQPKIFLRHEKNNRYLRKVLSKKTVNTLKKLLFRAVEQGTGKKAKVKGLKVGGKTGTAQKIDPDTRQYSQTKHVSSFCGFMPIEYPQIVCIVIIDEPDEKNFWASNNAAPLFSKIMQNVASILCIQ